MRGRVYLRRTLVAGVAIAAAYLAIAYVAAPEYWSWRDFGIVDPPSEMVTRTPQGIAGDPINVGLVGDGTDLRAAFAAAGWTVADPLDVRTSIGIGESVVLDRAYRAAPVSTLLFGGRRQDVAFEKPLGVSADRRHHVRFWATAGTNSEAGTLWLGAASFDRGVGLSRDTGQVTHHIDPDVDAERDFLMAEISAAGALADTMRMQGVAPTRDGRNGGGDPYFTDGEVKIGVLRSYPRAR